MVVVSPPPNVTHERRVSRVVGALYAALPPGLEVFASGLGVFYEAPSYVVPDVSVVRTADADAHEDGVHAPPVLVVEVLSPSTPRKDLLLKRDIYAELRVPSYWLLDPAARLLTVLTLRDGPYEETGRGERLELSEPCPVTIDLIG